MRRRNEILLLGLLCLVYWIVYGAEGEQFYRAVNWVCPAILAAVLGTSCYRIVTSNPIAIWAPLFWFRLASAVYFGFGALIPLLANETTLYSIYSLYYFNDRILTKVNFISSVSIFSVLAFSYLFLYSRDRRGPVWGMHFHTPSGRQKTLFFAAVFLTVGVIIRYGVSLPYALGLSDATVSGMILTFGKTFYVGVYLLILYAFKFNKKALIVAIPIVLFEVSVSIATFAKIDLILILIFTFLGFISRGASHVRLALGSALVLSAYFLFQPLVGFGRGEVNLAYDGRATIEERWAIVRSYFEGGAEPLRSDRQGGLSRLSYVNVNAFVVSRYDAGFPGNTLTNAAAVLIPRILWANKPIVTSIGSELNYLVFGRTSSSLGTGHFAEAYWNFGWMGIPPFMAVLALILSIFTRASMRIMARQDWLMLPVVFLGVNLGLRVDGFFVPDVLGAGWIALVLGIALSAARSMFLTLAFPHKGTKR